MDIKLFTLTSKIPPNQEIKFTKLYTLSFTQVIQILNYLTPNTNLNLNLLKHLRASLIPKAKDHHRRDILTHNSSHLV